MDNEVTKVVKSDGEGGEMGADEATPAAPEVGPGTTLGGYRLDRLIARGMTGEIYRGHNLTADKPCVVKVFHGGLPMGPVAWGRYVHESRLVSGLHTPAAAEVFYSGEALGRRFSVMNALPGEPLRGIVRQKAPLSRRFYMPVLRAVCGALAEVHNQGLFHGHFHGGQVMVQWQDERPVVSLLDFGVRHLIPGAKEPISGWERKAEHAIYLAPEQAKGLPGDARSDVYAVSVLLYEMVTGKVPFLASEFDETVEQIASEAPVAPGKLAQLPEAVEETILHGLEKDPRGRIPSVEALYAALDPRGLAGKTPTGTDLVGGTGRHAVLLSEADASAAPTATTGSLPPPLPLDELDDSALVGGSRRKLWIILAVVALLLVAGGVAAFLLTRGGGKEVKKAPPPPAVKKNKKPAPAARPPAKKAAKAKPAPAPPKKVAKLPAKATSAPALEPAPAPPEPEPEPGKKAPAPPTEVAAKALAGRARVHPAVATGMIKKVEGWGSLRVLTGDRNAKVFVDGNLRGAGEVVLLEKIPAGKHRIIVEKDGAKLPHKDVTVAVDQRLDVSF